VIPWLIFAAVLVPLCIVAFAALRRSGARRRDLVPDDEAARRRNEEEFAEAERYQEEWRAQPHRRDHDDDHL
jgi:hypothetical protein